MNRPTHYAEMYLRVCRYCGRNFMSKKADGEACYDGPCQRQKERDERRAKYLASKESKDAKAIQ